MLLYRRNGLLAGLSRFGLSRFGLPGALGGGGGFGLPSWPGRTPPPGATPTVEGGGGGGGGETMNYDASSLPTTGLPGVSQNVLRWQPQVQKYAAQYGVPVEAILAIIHNESGGNDKATSANNP